MKHFLRMIDIARGVNYVHEDEIRDDILELYQAGKLRQEHLPKEHSAPRHFWDVIEKANPFVLNMKMDNLFFLNEEEPRYDAPFSRFSIELLDSTFTQQHVFYPEKGKEAHKEVDNSAERREKALQAIMKKEAFPVSQKIFCYLFEEVGPRKFRVFSLRQYEGDKNPNIIEFNPNSDQGEYKTAIHVLSLFLKTLHSYSIGTQDIKHKVKLGKQAANRFHTIRKIVHVVPKEKKEVYISQGKAIDWTHRWLVRGHWRDLPNSQSLGKDREGNYTQVGKCWVTEYEKGPEDLPLIQKVRVLNNV